MTQSRTMSLVEAIANVAVGYGIAVLAQVVVFPLFGLHASLADNLLIGCVFTGISLVRGYLLRRLFETLRICGTRSKSAALERAAVGAVEDGADQSVIL